MPRDGHSGFIGGGVGWRRALGEAACGRGTGTACAASLTGDGSAARLVAIKAFRYIAFIEATSFIALLVASYVKHTGGGETGVEILGPIHGLLFIAYVVYALRLRAELEWPRKTTGLVLLGAVLPFGGYVVDWWLLRDDRATERPATRGES